MNFLNYISKLDNVYKFLIGLSLFITFYYGVFSWQVLIFIGRPLLLKIYTIWTCGKTTSFKRIDGKVAIVTGANSGIGYETAKELARRGGKVILACRSVEKGEKAAGQIRKETGSTDVSVMKLDLSSMKSVRDFCKEILSKQTKLNILVNNAGTQIMDKILTEDNLETNFASNHFGPFLLTNLLLDLMRKTGEARIIMVSSMVHSLPRSLDLDNLNSEKCFTCDFVLAKTKLANVLFTRELDHRFRAARITGLTVNALNPGLIKSQFFRHGDGIWYRSIINRIAMLFAKTVWEGAQTQIHLAVAEEVEGLSGLYWADCHEASISRVAQDTKLAKALWEKSVKAVGLTSEETIF